MWLLLEVDVVRYKRTFTLANPKTGGRMTGGDLISLSKTSLRDELPRATLLEFVSTAEVFIAELFTRWLYARPKMVSAPVESKECPRGPME